MSVTIKQFPKAAAYIRSRRGVRRCSELVPLQVFAEPDKPSQLFQYYLLDTKGFEPNIFTAIVPGINDSAIPTAANGANANIWRRSRTVCHQQRIRMVRGLDDS